MKKAIGLILLTGFSYCLLGQQATPAMAVSEFYLNKSKSQKTAAITLLSGGAVLSVLAFTIPPSDKEMGDFFIDYNVNLGRYIALFTGMGGMAGSIPLFIASGKNRKRAFGITGHFKMENATTLQQLTWVKTRYPALGIKINL